MKKRILISVIIGLLSLIGIVLATSDMNPRITYTGKGIPDPSVGRVGDIYVDLETSILYVMGTNGWGVFAVLPNPVNGTDGLNGATWIVGDTPPTGDLGSSGDLYFNYASLEIFHKIDGTWVYLTTIIGQQGPAGSQGPAGTDGKNGTDGKDGRNGSIWYNELLTSMTDNLGFDGDYYIFTNGTVYYKMSGAWVYFTSLIGPQGQTGPAGIKGTDGIDGKDGINGTTGPQGPAGPAGPQGETGATGATGATGETGSAGVQGTAGVDGSTGAKGADAPWWLYIILAAICGAVIGSITVFVAKRKDHEQQEA